MELSSQETVEEITDTSVEIARIEAERDITIAAINADARTTEAAAYAQTTEDTQWLRERLASVEAQRDLLETQVTALQTPSEPSPLETTEVLAETIQEGLAEAETISPSIQTDTLVNPSETLTVVTSEGNVHEAPAIAVVASEPARRRPIIHLV